jgi:hypothetical protein
MIVGIGFMSNEAPEGDRSLEEEVAHQRALAERVLRQPMPVLLKAGYEGELQDLLDRGAGDSRRAHDLRRFIRACEEAGG